MRMRNRSSQLIYPSVRARSGVLNWGPWESSACFSDTTEEMVDQVNPGYFPAQKLGLLKPVSPMQQTKRLTEVFTADALYEGDIKDWWSGQVTPRFYRFEASSAVLGMIDPGLVPVPNWPTVNEAAIVQSALASAQTNAWDKLTFAAEFHKSVEMLRTAQGRYKRHFDRVVNAVKRKRASGILTTFSEVWLEYRFGLRPIWYDILAVKEVIRRLEEGLPVLSRGWETDGSETSRTTTVDDSSFQAQSLQGGTVANVVNFAALGTHTRRTALVERIVEGRAAVGVHVRSRDLTFADPVLTAWELAPWSVFVDYFITLGDCLAAFSPMVDGQLAFATYTLKLTERVTQTGTLRPTDHDTVKWHGSSGVSTVVSTTESRFRTLVTPTPTLALQVDLDISRVIDLLSVAWGLRRKGPSIVAGLSRRR